MTPTLKSHRSTRKACHLIFSLLAVLAVLMTPLLTALPVYADWGADVRLTNAEGNSFGPRVAVSGNNVHVTWYDMRTGNGEIYYKRSIDGGNTWGPDIRLTTGSGGSYHPAIAVSGNNIHIVWYDNNDEIYYTHSTDSGTSWAANTRLTNDAAESDYPVVAVSGISVHVAWEDNRDGNFEIYYKRSTDSGATWGADTRLTSATGASYRPCITTSGSSVHIAWYDWRDGNTEIYYKRSTDGGATWGVDTRLSNNPRDSLKPYIAVSGNNIHVAWYDERHGDREVYYKRSTDGGASWGADTRLSNDPGDSRHTAIAASGSSVSIVWEDIRGVFANLFYRRSTDGGATWSAETRLTSDMVNSAGPHIAVSCNDAHVAWMDYRDGNAEIYYKKYSGTPAITSVNPKRGIQGETHSFTINGINFTGATGINFGDGVTVNSFKVDNDSKISVNITISPVAVPGVRNLTVTTCQGTATHNFWVDANQATSTPHSASMPAAPQGPVGLSAISVKSTSLSATKVAPGTTVTVTASVANTGTVNGNTSIKVYVNGELESSQGVTVNSGSSTPVTFDISRNEPGTYTVYVGGTNAGSFTVDELAGPGPVMIGAGLLFLALFIAIIILFRRNSQLSR